MIKSSFFPTIVLLCLSSLDSFSQEIKTVPTPELINQIYYYEPSSNTLKKLEKTTAEYKGKTKALGMGGSKVVCQIKGKTSSISFAQSDSLSFVVNLGENAADPSLWFQLYKADIKNNKREAAYVETNTLGKTKKSESIIKYDVKKIQDKLYRFIPSQKLGKGEYFFLYTMSYYNGSPQVDVFCFSIN